MMNWSNALFLTLSFTFGVLFSEKTHTREQLPIWGEGMLDTYHINTGRGYATFFIFPDGKTLLVDAGDMSETPARSLSARNANGMPNSLKSAPEGIEAYIHQFFLNKFHYFRSVEQNIATVVGPIDVATLNRHGNHDSQSTFYVRCIRPWV